MRPGPALNKSHPRPSSMRSSCRASADVARAPRDMNGTLNKWLVGRRRYTHHPDAAVTIIQRSPTRPGGLLSGFQWLADIDRPVAMRATSERTPHGSFDQRHVVTDFAVAHDMPARPERLRSSNVAYRMASHSAVLVVVLSRMGAQVAEVD